MAGTPRTLVLSRRRGGGDWTEIARAPFDAGMSLDVAALAGDADLQPGDVVRMTIDPPFHAVTDAPPRDIEIPWPVTDERPTVSSLLRPPGRREGRA